MLLIFNKGKVVFTGNYLWQDRALLLLMKQKNYHSILTLPVR